jgi:hypothetical protein
MNISRYSPAVLTLAVLLTACGGGSDSADGDAADAFVGTWRTSCIVEDNLSALVTFEMVKTAANNVTININATAYNNTSCAGTATAIPPMQGSFSINWQTGDAYRIDAYIGTNQSKELWLVQGNELHMNSACPCDEAGYPSKVASEMVLTR